MFNKPSKPEMLKYSLKNRNALQPIYKTGYSWDIKIFYI